MNLEESGKEYAEILLKALENTGVSTELDNPQEAFESGVYFGATKGYAKGVNRMLRSIPELLPDIFNQISASNFDMARDWVKEYQKLIINRLFEIDVDNGLTK